MHASAEATKKKSFFFNFHRNSMEFFYNKSGDNLCNFFILIDYIFTSLSVKNIV